MSRDSNMGSNLVFFLLGAATGAAVALLYAPQEGEATRRMIGEKATEVKDKASELSSNMATSAKEKWSAASDKVQELFHRGQQQASDTIERVADNAQQAVKGSS